METGIRAKPAKGTYLHRQAGQGTTSATEPQQERGVGEGAGEGLGPCLSGGGCLYLVFTLEFPSTYTYTKDLGEHAGLSFLTFILKKSFSDFT